MKILVLIVLAFLSSCHQGSQPVRTFVTALYDIGRGQVKQYTRPFSYYLQHFENLLLTPSNLIVFGNKDLKAIVWKTRKPENTIFVERQLSELRKMWYYPLIQKVRKAFKQNAEFWKNNQKYVQYNLEYYNVIMMSKVQFLYESLKLDKWNSDYMYWVDGGYLHNEGKNRFSPENVVSNYFQTLNQPWVYSRYQDSNMFNGFSQTEVRYVGHKIPADEMILANMYGGYIELVKDVKNTFQNVVRITLQNNDLNSDQSILALMMVRFPYLNPVMTNVGVGSFQHKVIFKSHSVRKHQTDRQAYAILKADPADTLKINNYPSKISQTSQLNVKNIQTKYFWKISLILLINIGIYVMIKIEIKKGKRRIILGGISS